MSRNAPFHIRFAVPVRLVAVAAGPRHSLAVDVDGRLWSWGASLLSGATPPCTRHTTVLGSHPLPAKATPRNVSVVIGWGMR